MPDTTLILAGTPELVVRMALLTYKRELEKTEKKEVALGLDTESTVEHLEAVSDLLAQLGWRPEKSVVEVVRGDDSRDMFDDDKEDSES